MPTTTLALLCQEADDLIKAYHQIESDDPAEREQMLARLLDVYTATSSKVDGLAWVCNDALPNELEQIDGFIAKLQQRKKQIESDVDRIKQYLLFLNAAGKIPNKLMGETRSIEIRRNTQASVQVESDPATWDAGFSDLYQVRVEYKPDKKAIAELDEAGLQLPPGCTVRRGYHVRFGWNRSGKKK